MQYEPQNRIRGVPKILATDIPTLAHRAKAHGAVENTAMRNAISSLMECAQEALNTVADEGNTMLGAALIKLGTAHLEIVLKLDKDGKETQLDIVAQQDDGAALPLLIINLPPPGKE